VLILDGNETDGNLLDCWTDALPGFRASGHGSLERAGRAGEVSRYQIRPDVWETYAAASTNWENPTDALTVAKQAMAERCSVFEKSARRPPTDFEFYVLWNAPGQIEHPSAAVSKRAERFCNLIGKIGS
jgi:hypothetical protein